MTNKEKYDDVFMSSFTLEKSQLNDDLVYESVAGWDSIGHMGMIAELEEKFNIEMETDDIIDFSGYVKGMKILEKYDISLEK